MIDETLAVLQKVRNFTTKNIRLDIKREDALHSEISGNKFRKLKYNLEAATVQNKKTLLTFGGAFSNHILATAAAGKAYGFKTIGIIRGEELALKIKQNPTLTAAQKLGMQLKFVSREVYRKKNTSLFLEALKQEFGDFYLLPEGGTNPLAVKGCEEILNVETQQYDYICCAVGTGGTLAGLINASNEKQQIIGFSVLKGNFLCEEISKFTTKTNWTLLENFHFGGYAKVNLELIQFINQFKQQNAIPLDPIYTGKMLFGIYYLMAENYFKENTKILAIHTGGLQGINGINIKLKQKGLETIQI